MVKLAEDLREIPDLPVTSDIIWDKSFRISDLNGEKAPSYGEECGRLRRFPRCDKIQHFPNS